MYQLVLVCDLVLLLLLLILLLLFVIMVVFVVDFGLGWLFQILGKAELYLSNIPVCSTFISLFLSPSQQEHVIWLVVLISTLIVLFGESRSVTDERVLMSLSFPFWSVCSVYSLPAGLTDG